MKWYCLRGPRGGLYPSTTRASEILAWEADPKIYSGSSFFDIRGEFSRETFVREMDAAKARGVVGRPGRSERGRVGR